MIKDDYLNYCTRNKLILPRNVFRSISPNELLPIGNPVLVQGKRGKVVEAKYVNASNGGRICLHTCKFTTRRVETDLYIKWKRINPAKVEEVNYAFIEAYL